MMLASTQSGISKKLHSLSVLRWGISPAIAYTTLTSHIINMMSLPRVYNCKSISNASFLYRHRSTTGRDATGQADHGMAPSATAAVTAATSARIREELPLHAASRAGDAKKVQALLRAFMVNIHLRDPDGLSALHVACEAGHIEIAKILLREGFANVDMRAGAGSVGGASRFARGPGPGPGPGPAGSSLSPAALAGMAPLHIACARGNMPLVRMLLGKPNEASSDITCATRGATAFFYACMYGQLSTATSLVEEGLCRPQIRDSLGYTALHAACESGHEAVVRYLLSLPVLWLNAQDSLGFTPLQRACQANCEAVVRMLLKEGASISHKNSAGATALLLACAGGYVNIARILVLEPGGGEMNSAEASSSGEDQRPMTPHFAMTTHMSKNKLEMRASHPTSNIQGMNKETSQDGANVDVKDNLGWTALHHAAAAGHIDMINVCVSELGSPVNMRTKRGEMAIHLAAARGNAAAVHALVANGARVDVQHQYGRYVSREYVLCIFECFYHCFIVLCIRLTCSSLFFPFSPRLGVRCIWRLRTGTKV